MNFFGLLLYFLAALKLVFSGSLVLALLVHKAILGAEYFLFFFPQMKCCVSLPPSSRTDQSRGISAGEEDGGSRHTQLSPGHLSRALGFRTNCIVLPHPWSFSAPSPLPTLLLQPDDLLPTFPPKSDAFFPDPGQGSPSL